MSIISGSLITIHIKHNIFKSIQSIMKLLHFYWLIDWLIASFTSCPNNAACMFTIMRYGFIRGDLYQKVIVNVKFGLLFQFKFFHFIFQFQLLPIPLSWLVIAWITTDFIYTLKLILISWTTIVVHSRDNEEVGVAHEVKSPKNQPQFFQMMMGSIG